MAQDRSDDQEVTWGLVLDRIRDVLAEFGVEDPMGGGDYLVVDDNYGFRWNTVEIHSLRMLKPAVVKALQARLEGIDDWEIVVAVDVPGTEDLWPPMGLTIHATEIIDSLERAFLPPEYRDLIFEGARPGPERNSAGL
ncbi:hypothetical protein [Rhodoplanes roseus]|uniref:Uncharacterized protein n=1 Tax=Rhodoplanes roseus TaxID=29409 RepID=A0A327L3M1_9BRAD|nr:hypothetical protein [Rhodoplanes roseus]RAI44092.1 hypothetical protein CH341_10925 [Rhodoplanes roseus]